MYEYTNTDGSKGRSTVLEFARERAIAAGSTLTYRGDKNEILWVFKP